MQDLAGRLRRKISEQERMIEILGSAARRGEEAARLFDSEQARRIEAVKKLSEVKVELEYAREENRRLRQRIEEQDRLKRRIEELEIILETRKAAADPYGLSTPSSKRVNKRNSTEENRSRRGGARPGHRGSGRKAFSPQEADRVVPLDEEPPRCGCGGEWDEGKVTEHSVFEFIPSRLEKVIYRKRVRTCLDCGRSAECPTPGAMPNCLYGNSTVANALVEHYVHGTTAGGVTRRTGIGRGAFLGISHRTAEMFRPAFMEILAQLRVCRILHADETGWTMDGEKAYAWLFANMDFRVFLFRRTRASSVPGEVLGDENPELVLVTDRYSGYSPLNVTHQYCFVHLLRDVKKEEKDFPEDQEVLSFAQEMKPLLSDAILLRKMDLEPEEHSARAEQIRIKIMELCLRPAEHPAVRNIQSIFRENRDRLFQWVRSPEIPADNNYAERELRPTVIARKISFGSQSERGMETREILMTILHTVRCRGHDPARFLKEALDKLAQDRNTDVSSLIPEIGLGKNV